MLLDHIAQNTGLTVISVEYRLAPEHVFPAGLNDCTDVAAWLATAGKETVSCSLILSNKLFDSLRLTLLQYGPLLFLGGESAGGTMTASVLLKLRAKSLLSTVLGSVLNYGCFDLSLLPSALSGTGFPVLVTEQLLKFTATYIANSSVAECKSGEISPMYNDLSGLGSALFLIGTEDTLMDDSLLMHFRWLRSGNTNTTLRFVAGAPHGFMTFNGNTVECATEGWKIMIEYLKERMR